jgi:hypothetical protein
MKLIKKEIIDKDDFMLDCILYVQLERDETVQNIYDEMDIGWRDCPHTHDCCGCWGYNIWGKVVHIQDRIYRFRYYGRVNI